MPHHRTARLIPCLRCRIANKGCPEQCRSVCVYDKRIPPKDRADHIAHWIIDYHIKYDVPWVPVIPPIVVIHLPLEAAKWYHATRPHPAPEEH